MSLSVDTPKSKSKSPKYTRIDTDSHNNVNDKSKSPQSRRFLAISKSISPRPSKSKSNKNGRKKGKSPSPQASHARKSIALNNNVNKSHRSHSSNSTHDVNENVINDESSLLTDNNNTSNHNDTASNITSQPDTDTDTQSHIEEDIEDESESETETETKSDEMTPIPITAINSSTKRSSSNKQRHKGSIYNFQANEQILKQELVQDMLERLKIALTFLLHDNSPLWNEDEKDDDNYIPNEDDISSIYAKGTLSTGNLIHKPMKKQWSGRSVHSIKSNHSNHNNNNNRTTRYNLNFQKRCTEYTMSAAADPRSFKRNHQKLNSLYDDKYIEEWRKLYKLWSKWLDYADLLQQGHTIDNTDLHTEMLQNQQILEVYS